jgi:sporulation integral membrane protein YlbJ
MRKKMINILIIAVVLFIGAEILRESSSILQTVNFSMSIYEKNIFPSLFPFFVISDILINCGFASFLGELLKPFMYYFFKIKVETAFILVLSMLSGFPSSAKYTKELYEKGLINEYEASKILTFTHFSNPLFIIGTLSIMFLNNTEIGFLILFCHYIGNFIIGLIFRNYYVSERGSYKISLRKAVNKMYEQRLSNPYNFGQIVTNSLMKAINTLLLILGVITMFLVITTIIDNLVNLSTYNQSILNGVLELTQGLKYTSILPIPLKNKAVLATLFLSFGGLSVHMQTISIISDTKIKYYPFFVARLLHSSFSCLLVYLLYDYYWYIFG